MALRSGIRDPGSGKIYSGSRIQGSKRHRIPDPQHCRIHWSWIPNWIHWFRIRHFRLNPGLWWPKFEKHLQVNLIFFWSKMAIRLPLSLHKKRPSYRRSLQPSKNNIQHFKTLNSLQMFPIISSAGWFQLALKLAKLLAISRHGSTMCSVTS